MKRIMLLILTIAALTSCEYFIMPQIDMEPKLYMLAIGVGYEHSAINPLSYTKSDMKAITSQMETLLYGKMDYEILTLSDESDGFVLKRYEPMKEVRLKTYDKNKLISKEEFKEIFTEGFTSTPEENDILLFYYAGHGDTDTGSLVYTYRYGNLMDYDTISSRDLYDDVLSLFNSRKLVILDSCYSGTFIEEGSLASTIFYSGKDAEETFSRFDLFSSIGDSFSSLNSGNSSKPDIFVITAAGSDQLSYENVNGIRHGLFTYALLAYLDYDLDAEEARYTTKFDQSVISVSDLYNGIVDNYPVKNYYRKSTTNTTPSKYDMVIFDFR